MWQEKDCKIGKAFLILLEGNLTKIFLRINFKKLTSVPPKRDPILSKYQSPRAETALFLMVEFGN
jgi:hypothetical protein